MCLNVESQNVVPTICNCLFILQLLWILLSLGKINLISFNLQLKLLHFFNIFVDGSTFIDEITIETPSKYDTWN